jgi:hypothetical protein
MTKLNRTNIYLPRILGQRARDAGVTNLSYVCQAAIRAATEAAEGGVPVTLTFSSESIRRLVIRSSQDA